MKGTSFPNLVHFSQLGFRILHGNGVNGYGCLKFNLLGVRGSSRQMCTSKSGQLSKQIFCSKSFTNPNLWMNTKGHCRKTFVRQYSDRPPSFSSPSTIERFRRRDGIPKSYNLVYRSNLPNYLLCSQIALFLTIGASVTAGMLYLATEKREEERGQSHIEKQLVEYDNMKQDERESALGQFVATFKKDYNEPERIMHHPDVRDVILEKEDPSVMLMVAVSFVGLALALFRLQRTVPVRIYMGINNKKHCIAIMYGHILPGRVTWHEFIAGTLTPYKRPKSTDSLVDHAVFKDGSGRTLVVIERFFRTPADYNKVMGFGQDQEENDAKIRKSG